MNNNNDAKLLPILSVRNLTKRFGKKPPAITDLNFDVMPGEFHAFIGANGAGKTTTIKCIIGAYLKKEGTILINGIDNLKPEAKLNIGYIPEYTKFPPHFSTYEYLLSLGKIMGLPKALAEQRINTLLDKLHMSKIRNESPNKFSSGQKKKVILIQALLINPKLLIMDEPTANLDPKARIEFFEVLKDLQKQGSSFFISTHILSEVNNYADSLTILDGGKIVLSGKIDEIQKRYISDNNKYLIKVDNNAKCEEILKRFNVEYKWNDFNHEYIAKIKSTDTAADLLKTLIGEKLSVINFAQYRYSLDEIYEEYVRVGSVHTRD